MLLVPWLPSASFIHLTDDPVGLFGMGGWQPGDILGNGQAPVPEPPEQLSEPGPNLVLGPPDH